MSRFPLRIALVADLLEERWHSMDLVADMLMQEARRGACPGCQIDLLRPSFASAENGATRRISATLRRYRHRFWDYPRWLGTKASAYDVYHIVDHSYAHLAHVLPPDRTLVTCHDIDAFAGVVEPGMTRSKLPTWLVRRVLTGLQRAAMVSCVSEATRQDLLRHDLVPSERLVVVPNGVHPALTTAADPRADNRIDALLGATRDVVDVLHVGTCIPRKRIDVLLKAVAAVRESDPRVRLVKAGGTLTAGQRAEAAALGLEAHLVQMPFLSPDELAALYRRATVVMITSEREGFGLPLIEAMASGTPVVATDIAVLREVGGDAATYRPLENVGAWRDAVLRLIRDDHRHSACRDAGIRWAGRFTWSEYASRTAALYHRISQSAGVAA